MNNRRKTLPALSGKIPSELRPIIEAMREIIETGEGVRGNRLDQKLTYRDLLGAGVLKLKNPSIGVGGGVEPVLPTPDMSIPPRPTGFTATGGFYGIVSLGWDVPQRRYNNHAYTNIYRSEDDNFANAQLIGRDAGFIYSDKVRNDQAPSEITGYFYWITFTSEANVEGPPNSPDGTYAEPLPDLQLLLDQLSGEVNESVLSQALRQRLDGFDAAIAEEIINRAKDIAAEAEARTSAIADEVEARNAAIASEAQQRIQGLLDEATARAQDVSGLQSAVVDVNDARIADGVAVAERFDGLIAMFGENDTAVRALITAEREAWSSANEARTLEIEAANSRVEEAEAAINRESSTRADEISAQARRTDDLITLFEENDTVVRALITAEREAWSSADAARTQEIEATNSRVGEAESAILAERNTRTSQYDSLVQDHETLSSKVDNNDTQVRGLIDTERQARTTATNALTEQMQLAMSKIGDNTSAIVQAESTWADALSAQARRTDDLVAVVEGNDEQVRGLISDAQETWATDRDALAEQLQTISTTVGENRSTIQQHTQSINGLGALWTMQMDVNGYVSGLGMHNNGVTADFAILADRFYIAAPGTDTPTINPFMVLDGKTYIDTALIREASIQEGQLGPIGFGKIFDSAGNPVTNVAGKLRVENIDVESLQVGNQQISGVLQSNQLGANGRPRWRLDKDAGLEMNGRAVNGIRMELGEDVLKFIDANGVARIHAGRANA